MNSGDAGIDEKTVLDLLKVRSSGLTTREMARRLSVRPSDLNKMLLQLQVKGQVSLRGMNWSAVNSTSQFPSNIQGGGGERALGSRGIDLPNARLDNPSQFDSGIESNTPTSKSVDRHKSRWAVFRRLCDYYAECIRLDQRSSITATANDEFESIVCLDGALPNSNRIHVRTRESWHRWVRKLAEDEYLFVGYPIQRYRWRDTQKGEDVDFITPVFVQPFRVKINGTHLDLESIGSIRINEGWLERRLKNVDERRVFLELCGTDSIVEDGVNEATWSECGRLLNHFYPDWCVERLDTNSTCSTPPFASIGKDGIYNRASLIIPRKWKFTGSLYKELIALANEIPDEELDRTSLELLFPHTSAQQPSSDASVKSPPDSSADLVGTQVLRLNHEQMLANVSASRCHLTVVVGPPGTGKSRVVAAVLAQQAIRGRSTLLASRNHQALEAVVPRINAITDPLPVMIRLARPWGAPADLSLHTAIHELVASDFVGDATHLQNVRLALTRRIAEHANASMLVDQVGKLRETIQKQLFDLDEILIEIPDAFHELVADGCNKLPTTEDIDRVAELIFELPPFSWSVRWFLSFLFSRKRLAKGVAGAGVIDRAMRAIFDKEDRLPHVGTGSDRDLAVFYRRVLEYWRPFTIANAVALNLRELRVNLNGLPSTDEVCRREYDAAKEVERLSVECFVEVAKQIGAGITKDERCLLANILASIDNRSALDSEADHRRWSNAMRKAFPVFLKHFPLVATTNLSIKRDIDLQPSMFDLLVIDEASQCDVASVIPLLFRARRVLIVGDPMQLSHVTTLSSATDRHLRRQFGVGELELERFSYRTTSMFHLANTSPSVDSRVSLRQHHRCHPSIAAYCSETFYKGAWTVLTQHTGSRGIVWSDIPDDSESAPGGGAVSQNQIEAICRELVRLEKEGFKGSLGIVTPFRQQANRIRDKVHDALPHNFVRGTQLLVDTADGFQGDERDLVLFSLVAGDSLPDGAMNFLANGPNRFNVAVSRAKLQLHVFGDLGWTRRSKIRHIKQLADFYDRECAEQNHAAMAGFREDLVGPIWEPALAGALRKAGIEFYQQYPACGRFLDFAIFRNGLKLNVEVDGETYHRSVRGVRRADDIRRDQALIASGWKIQRFWVYELRENLDGCVSKISMVLEKS